MQECILPRGKVVFRCGTNGILRSKFFKSYARLRALRQRGNYSCIQISSSAQSRIDANVQRLCVDTSQELPALRTVDLLKLAPKIFSYSVFPTIKPSIIRCLHLCYSRCATRKHDYIYGLLGLASAKETACIRIDYNRPYEELYHELTKQCFYVSDLDSATVFSRFSFCESLEGCPSWVLNFSLKPHERPWTGRGLSWKKSWGSFKDVRFSGGDRLLMAKGTFLDVVERVDGAIGNSTLSDSKLDLCKVKRAISEQKHYRDSELIPATIRPMSQRSLRLLFSPPREPDSRQVADDILDYYWESEIFSYHPMPQTPENPAAENLRFRYSSKYRCESRSLIVTTRGLLGISIPGVEKGDVVACLRGTKMAWILRPIGISIASLAESLSTG